MFPKRYDLVHYGVFLETEATKVMALSVIDQIEAELATQVREGRLSLQEMRTIRNDHVIPLGKIMIGPEDLPLLWADQEARRIHVANGGSL